jgi:hypothetical protein
LRGEHNSLQVQTVPVRLIHVQHSMISVPLVITNFCSRVWSVLSDFELDMQIQYWTWTQS